MLRPQTKEIGEIGPTPGEPEAVQVWDTGIRVFHWLLAGAVSVSLATGFFDPILWLRWHLVSGCTIAALVFFRLVWGFFGTRHARFADFAYPFSEVVRHARNLAARRPARFVGHNPLGSLMVFTVLLVLAAMVGTGIVVLGGFVKEGPLAPFTRFTTGRAVLEVHETLAWFILAMVVAHLAGVAAESLLTRENLVLSMLTGRKQGGAPVSPEIRGAPRVTAVIVLGGVALVTAGVMALANLPPYGVPPAELDPEWKLQCGACHFAYPPSLAPASVWDGMFADLKHHFGRADATLGPELETRLKAYADANSAEHWDTLPAHVFRVRDPADPGRLTATPFWRRRHREIPKPVFNSPKVAGNFNCNACHHDAETGRFAPQAIAIPPEAEAGQGPAADSGSTQSASP
ncbi:MAG: cytochrome b/b6 domain-containing protein [Acetobacteraceae bacterium]|nr:cytochrome b/b6 domain-containing protein [Acetobacteraceae bacterium]